MEDDDLPPDIIRAPEEVARRALAVFSVVCLALGEPKDEIVEFLQENDLYDALAPSERRFIETPSPTEEQIIDASWLSERLVALCWALRLIEELPRPDEKCDPDAFPDILPPFAEVEVADFIDDAVLRPDAELIEMADKVLYHHWEARHEKLTGTPPRTPVDIEIIQERHHALNWVIGYESAAWDDVMTDT
jgi:hypothetical protein